MYLYTTHDNEADRWRDLIGPPIWRMEPSDWLRLKPVNAHHVGCFLNVLRAIFVCLHRSDRIKFSKLFEFSFMLLKLNQFWLFIAEIC